MKKLKQKSGFSLMELLVALAVFTLLSVGIITGMKAGFKVYKESTFLSDSSSLAGIIHTTMGDMLRYSVDVQKNTGSFPNYNGDNLGPDVVEFVFTSDDYGLQAAYFPKAGAGTSDGGQIFLRNLNDSSVADLVNSGAYPNLKVSDLKVDYVPSKTPKPDGSQRGGYFNITYKITDLTDSTLTESYTHVVRLMNDDPA